MNNCSQLLEQAENLKKELSNGRNGLSSDGSGTGEWISSRTSLQDVYRQLLITNLEYALDKKIEQDLWNFVFKNHITALQQQVKDKLNNFRVEAQSQLTAFLDAASGFYAHLLDDLCSTFQINISCRVKSSKLVFLKDSSSIKQSSITQPERPSCQYMCQHCLVHLGDIARYRNQNGQAESYYRHAAQLVPSNGQPYNQLAILAAASGDVLSTAFYYCRSLAVKYPFPGSDTNLRRQLTKIMAGDEPRHTKISTSELIKFCLKFHACIYLKKHEDELSGMVERLSAYIRAHLRAGSLSRQQITHISFLNLFSLYHLAPNGVDGDGNPLTISDVATAEAEKEKSSVPWQAMLTFTMHLLGGLLACVPAHSDDASDLEHPALPAVKIILDWLTSNSAVLNRKEITTSSRVWPRLAKVLNALGNQDKVNDLNNKPLPEDLELRGFVGLKQPLSKLDFAAGIDDAAILEEMEHACRSFRLYRLGLAVSSSNSELLSIAEEDAGTVFGSSIAPSPQHASGSTGGGAKVNGVEEQKEMEETNEEEDDQEQHEVAVEEPEIAVSPPKQGGTRKVKEVRLMEPGVPPRRNPRNRGVLKAPDEHHGSNRKNNRAPRMQNVAVQIKPENKLKVIKEEESGYVDAYSHGEGGSEGGISNESSQGDRTSPNTGTQPRSAHRVTFAPPVHMSPTQHLHDEPGSPGAVGPNFMDTMGVVLPTVYAAETNARLLQQTYNRNIHLGPIYHQNPTPPGNPILTAPFAHRNIAPFGYPHPQNVVTRPHIPVQHLPPLHQQHHLASTPPHPAELPKPMFTGPRYSHLLPPGADNFSAPPAQLAGSPSENLPRPSDIGFMLPQNVPNLASMSPQDQSPTQRNLAQNLFLQGRYARGIPGLQMAHSADLDPAMDFRLPASTANSASSNYSSGNRGNNSNLLALERQRMDFQMQQLRAQHPNLAIPPPQKMDPPPDLAGSFEMPGERSRNLYHPFISPSSTGNLQGAGSNNNSSASSPTPASLGNIQNHSASPQAGSIGNYSAIGSMMNHQGGFQSMFNDTSSSSLDATRRPTSLIGGQRQQPPGFAGSPSQSLTPTGLNSFLAEAQSKQQQQQLPENLFARDNINRTMASMFGISPSSGTKARPFSQAPATQPTDAYNYAMNRDRMKALFDEAQTQESENIASKLSESQFKSLLAQQPGDKMTPPGLLLDADKDSYKLFPDTGNTWGVSRGSNGGDSLGLSGLGIIGGERPVAKQQHSLLQQQQQLPHQYSPWGGLPSSTSSGSSGLPEAPTRSSEQQPPRNIQEAMMKPMMRIQQQPPASNEDGSTSQSFWSTPMMPSGPSALEKLINMQQQNLTGARDRSPP